jgi:hypothetical protein
MKGKAKSAATGQGGSPSRNTGTIGGGAPGPTAQYGQAAETVITETKAAGKRIAMKKTGKGGGPTPSTTSKGGGAKPKARKKK